MAGPERRTRAWGVEDLSGSKVITHYDIVKCHFTVFRDDSSTRSGGLVGRRRGRATVDNGHATDENFRIRNDSETSTCSNDENNEELEKKISESATAGRRSGDRGVPPLCKSKMVDSGPCPMKLRVVPETKIFRFKAPVNVPAYMDPAKGKETGKLATRSVHT